MQGRAVPLPLFPSLRQRHKDASVRAFFSPPFRFSSQRRCGVRLGGSFLPFFFNTAAFQYGPDSASVSTRPEPGAMGGTNSCSVPPLFFFLHIVVPVRASELDLLFFSFSRSRRRPPVRKASLSPLSLFRFRPSSPSPMGPSALRDEFGPPPFGSWFGTGGLFFLAFIQASELGSFFFFSLLCGKHRSTFFLFFFSYTGAGGSGCQLDFFFSCLLWSFNW